MMTDQRGPALAAPLTCPDWCKQHRTNESDDSIWHGQCSPEDGRGRFVLVTQADMPANYGDDEPGWIREDATINVMYADGIREFDLTDLTPEQGYALAALVGRAANERLASLLLDAVEMLKPELVR